MIEPLSLTNFFKHPRFWRHAIPWAVVSIFLYISIYIESVEEERVFEGANSLVIGVIEIFVLVYSSFYVYNILYKKKNKKALFFVALVGIIIGVALVDHLFTTRIVSLGAVKGFWANIILFPLLVTVAFGLKLSYHGTKQLFVIERLQAKQTESELKLLKSQVNPHFLFNTLNNIYSTNLQDHEKANEFILELSDLLRYQLESYKTKFTPLDREIKSIENYIDLEKIRVLDCKVEVSKQGNFENAEIVPLLLLPFVENAFKYGTGIEPGQIDIDIQLTDKRQFYFAIKNRIVQKKGKVHSGGIGLENVKKRLALMYPEKHKLVIKDDGQHFSVKLKMQL